MPTYSVRPYFRADSIRKKDGKGQINLLVGINSDQFRIGTGIYIDPKEWHKETHQVRKSHPKYNDLNIEIRTRLAEANSVFEDYRRRAQPLNKEIFLQEYQNPTSRQDFIEFMRIRIERRVEKSEIVSSTAGKHRTTLQKLKSFRKNIPFSQISKNLLDDFDLFHLRYLRSLKGSTLINDGIGPRSNAIKAIKTYLRLAQEDGIECEIPKYSLTAYYPEAPHLLQSEVKELIRAYRLATLGQNPEHWIEILRCSLGMIFSGMSYVDTQSITWEDNIIGDMEYLKYIRNKQNRYRKTVTIPITSTLKKYLGEKQDKGLIFKPLEPPYFNRQLKNIAMVLGLNPRLQTKMFRDTFGTIFAEETGGDILTLQQLMGHSKIQTTAKYVHLSTNHINKQMEKVWEKFLEED